MAQEQEPISLPSIDETIRTDQLAKIASVLRSTFSMPPNPQGSPGYLEDVAALVLDTLLNTDPTAQPLPGWRIEITVEAWGETHLVGSEDYHLLEMGSMSQYPTVVEIERTAWRKLRQAISDGSLERSGRTAEETEEKADGRDN